MQAHLNGLGSGNFASLQSNKWLWLRLAAGLWLQLGAMHKVWQWLCTQQLHSCNTTKAGQKQAARVQALCWSCTDLVGKGTLKGARLGGWAERTGLGFVHLTMIAGGYHFKPK